MRLLFIFSVAIILFGCTSLQSAGVADYSVRPIVIGEKTVCCEVIVKNGKEYASLKARIEKTGDNYRVELEEQSVQAFAGQAHAADTVAAGITSAAAVGATLIGGPAIGAGLQALRP